MSYTVKEIFYTLQGEGAHTGRPAVFLRFVGCNLWSGLERDRATALCKFCDTDFVGTGPEGGKFATPDALATVVDRHWPAAGGKFVVCTGGEPLLQLDLPLIESLKGRGFEVAVETNGTLPVPAGVDWICVSPKGRNPVVQTHADELKFVYPQDEIRPEDFEHYSAERLLLQPMDGPMKARNTAAATAYCKAHPRWRLSLQTHKLLGIR